MNKTEIIKVIQKQIDDASPIIERINCMKPIPVRPSSDGHYVSKKTEYGMATVKMMKEEIKKWQLKSNAVLSACFNGENEHKESFERTFVDNHGLYYDAKEELLNEINNGRLVLSAIIEEESLRSEIEANIEKELDVVNGPLVFISHAGNDAAIIRDFIDIILKNGIGLKDEDIACTSFEWTSMSIGDNIPIYIRDNIQNAKVVLSLVSHAYKNSEVCQNEVGAAWALGNTPMSILLPDVDFESLGWLFGFDKAIKIDNPDSLNKLQVDLCSRLNKQPTSALHWSP